MEFAEVLHDRVAGLVSASHGLSRDHSLDLSEEQVALLQTHYELLIRWNRTLNLTRIEGVEEAVERHYVEGLFLGMHLPLEMPSAGGLRIADIGSGAGFPGVPVAVLRPDCHVTLIESHQRKAVFLREATRGLANVTVVAKRAEEVKGEVAGKPFDICISRAVSYDDLAKPLRALAGSAYLLTGAEEPPAKLGFVWQDPIPVVGKTQAGKHRFLRIGKVSQGTER